MKNLTRKERKKIRDYIIDVEDLTDFFPSRKRPNLVRFRQNLEGDNCVDAYGPLPNANFFGWYFYGYVDDVLEMMATDVVIV